MLINNEHLAELNSPKQTIKARVELYKGSTLERICNCGDLLSEITLERTGEGKFFGFGICQKLNTVLIDLDRDINVTYDHTIEAAFGVNSNYIYPFPNFYVQDIERDETSNTLKITAYDILFQAEKYHVSDLGLKPPYTIRTVTAACAHILGVPLVFINVDPTTFDIDFPKGANFDGTESVRFALNAISEVTQTIYYMNSRWELTFQRLNRDAAAALTIGPDAYIDLLNQDSRTITNIAHVTDLGDNTATVGDSSGVTQFIRNNPFWELRDDLGVLLTQAQANIGGLTINQFESTWSGNYLLEIGDKIGFTSENGQTLSTFLLDDTITFDGTLLEFTRWKYDDNEGETFTNPVTLGDALNQTYARVDKANKRIDLVTSEVTENGQKIASLSLTTDEIKAEVKRVEDSGNKAIASLTLTTEEIKAEVERVEENGNQAIANLQIEADEISSSVKSVENLLTESVDNLNNSIATLTKEVETTMTSEQLEIAIRKELDDGVNKVTTATGFTFDEKGLTVSKSNSEMSTIITEDGMTISRNEDEMLKADHTGVKATNLHATTYLIVGGRSRFENYGSDRTGCFWIGGNS